MVAPGQPQVFVSHAQPAAAGERGRSSQAPSVGRHPTSRQTTTAPPSQNVISTAAYQQLLAELHQRNQDHERLQQVFKQLLTDFSNLQNQYERAISKIAKTSPSLSSPTGDPAVPLHTYNHERERTPQPARRREVTDAVPPDRTASRNDVGNLPELSILNRLRKQAGDPSSRLEQNSKSMANSAVMANLAARANPAPQAAIGNHPLPLVEGIAPSQLDRDEHDSAYQRARQEHTQGGTPLWMWMVAWLLLLPISAGLGYAVVQWTMNSANSVDIPAQITPAE